MIRGKTRLDCQDSRKSLCDRPPCSPFPTSPTASRAAPCSRARPWCWPTGPRPGSWARTASGKTTLFRLILGQIALDGGSIEVNQRARIGAVAQEAPATDTERARHRDGGRHRARGADGRGRNSHRCAPHRRHPHAARRYRRAHGRSARRDHPQGPRLRAGPAARPDLGAFGRLAHARGAGGRAVQPARPAAARRADQLSRSRRHAVAREVSRDLSLHRVHDQPRPRPAQQGGDLDRPSRARQAATLQGRLRHVRRDAPHADGAQQQERARRRSSRSRTCRASSTASRPRPPRPSRRRRASR